MSPHSTLAPHRIGCPQEHPVQIRRRTDQSQMRKRLREVPQVLTARTMVPRDCCSRRTHCVPPETELEGLNPKARTRFFPVNRVPASKSRLTEIQQEGQQ